MSRNVTKAMGNRYCQARLEAAKYNEKLLVRSSAVEFLPGVTEDSLKKYELDINRPPNTVVALMADAYSAPDLTAWYCANECPLGKDRREIPKMPAERALIRLQNSAEDMDDIIRSISQIMDDGEITGNEKEEIAKLIAELKECGHRINEITAILDKASKRGEFDR